MPQDTAPPPAPPPRPGRPWSAALAVGVSQASLGFLLSSLGSCLILLARDFSLPRGELAWLSAGFGAFLLVVGVAGAPLLRLGAQRVLSGAAVALGLGGLLLAFAASVPAAQAGALLLGAGGAGLTLVSPALLSGPEAEANLLRVNAASSLTGVSAPLLMSALEALTGHGRWALLLPLPAVAWVVATARGPAAPRPAPAPGAPRWPSVRRLTGRWLSLVAAVVPEFAFVVWGAARLQDSGLSPAAAAAAAAAFPVGMGVGRLFAPRLVGRAPVVGWGASLAIAACLLAAAPVGPAPVALSLVAAGLGLAALYPATLARLVETPGLGLRHGAALGATASGTAVLAAPALLNAVARRIPLRTAFLVVVPALALVLVLQRRRRGPWLAPSPAAGNE